MSDTKQTSFDGIEPDEVTPIRRPGPGRPRGTRGKFRSTLDKALRSQWHLALANLMQGVAERDPTCTRLYWERVMPAPKRMAIELTTPDNKPLRVETPADARAAMAQILSMVAAGELASDEADELVTCYGKYLAANSIHTISEGTAEAVGESALKVFNERLAATVAARKTSEAEASAPEGGPDAQKDT